MAVEKIEGQVSVLWECDVEHCPQFETNSQPARSKINAWEQPRDWTKLFVEDNHGGDFRVLCPTHAYAFQRLMQGEIS